MEGPERYAMDAAQVKVLIVDHHDLFRTGLRALLEEEGFEVADATGGADGICRAHVFAPDVVVMELQMPGMTGVEATPPMLRAAPGAAILILTVATDWAEVLDAVRAGASSYLLKDSELSVIVAGIRAAAAGESTIAASVAGCLLRSVRTNDGAPSSRVTDHPELSVRERQVLTLVTDGCDNAEIAGRLYVSLSTVKSHMSRLFEKLGVDNRVQAATFAIRQGLSDPPLRPREPARDSRARTLAA
jgi:two-component system, NarL family, response regulator LiaR